jgi:hypothetical protein
MATLPSQTPQPSRSSGKWFLGWPRPNVATLRALTQLGWLGLCGGAAFAALSVYEALALGRPPLGERPPVFETYDLLRTAAALLLSLLAVALVYRQRDPGSALATLGMSKAGGAVAALLTATGFASILLLLHDPAAFASVAREDGPVEWLSAAALFAGSALFLATALKARKRDKAAGALALAFAAVLFLVAMEEISWMQRVLDFRTPEELAAVNLQGEFNLHNVHTDYSENIYYLGAFLLLVALPFLGEALPWLRSPGPFSDFIPGRWVAAVAAPTAMLNYGMWNVIPMQVSMMTSAAVLLAFSLAANKRGDRRESLYFAVVAAMVIVAQILLLATGHRMLEIYDASEYKELFIALGLACFALDANRRAAARTAPPPGT